MAQANAAAESAKADSDEAAAKSKADKEAADAADSGLQSALTTTPEVEGYESLDKQISDAFLDFKTKERAAANAPTDQNAATAAGEAQAQYNALNASKEEADKAVVEGNPALADAQSDAGDRADKTAAKAADLPAADKVTI
jgi:hypothetical protein